MRGSAAGVGHAGVGRRGRPCRGRPCADLVPTPTIACPCDWGAGDGKRAGRGRPLRGSAMRGSAAGGRPCGGRPCADLVPTPTITCPYDWGAGDGKRAGRGWPCGGRHKADPYDCLPLPILCLPMRTLLEVGIGPMSMFLTDQGSFLIIHNASYLRHAA